MKFPFAGAAQKAAGVATGAAQNKGKLIFAIGSVLVTIPAIVLTVLAIYAGNKPGFMQDYAVFTLNTSQIGEGAIKGIDNAINSAANIHLRAVPTPAATLASLSVPTAVITTAPQAAQITPMAAAEKNVISDAASDLSKATSAAHSAASAAGSKISSATSAAGAAATSAIAAIKNTIIADIDNGYTNFLHTLNVSDFVSLYLDGMCHGTYVMKNGTDIVPGNVNQMNATNLKSQVDGCSKLSALDPLSAIRVMYWIGLVFTILALILGFTGIFITRVARFGFHAAIAAFVIILLVSASIQALSSGAAKLINFAASHIGVEAEVGGQFLALTWATVVLLGINAALWGALYYFEERLGRLTGGFGGGRRKKKFPTIRKVEATEMV
jgi:hypothetical protein